MFSQTMSETKNTKILLYSAAIVPFYNRNINYLTKKYQRSKTVRYNSYINQIFKVKRIFKQSMYFKKKNECPSNLKTGR